MKRAVRRLPPKGPETGGTTLINVTAFSLLTVIAGATLYFHTELQGRFHTFPLKIFQLTDLLSEGFLHVLILFFAF